MPCCAVKICGNRSMQANFKSCGVTYHRFPKDPKLKKIWIAASGRPDDWLPTHNSVICNTHFEDKCFLPIVTSHRLFPDAVPTLKLRLVFQTPTETSKDAMSAKKILIKPAEKKIIVERYKVQIEKYKAGMQKQKMHIKRLQKMVQRYRKKATVLKDILTALKDEHAISEDHLWLLDSDGIINSQ